MMMMSLSPSGLGSASPLLPTSLSSKKPSVSPLENECDKEAVHTASNTAGLATEDLKLLRQLQASSEESPVSSTESPINKRASLSGAMLEAQLPNISRHDICRQDGLCSACAVEEVE